MTARDFINQLEMFIPDLNQPLDIKLADTGEPCKIWTVSGSGRIIFYITKKKHP